MVGNGVLVRVPMGNILIWVGVKRSVGRGSSVCDGFKMSGSSVGVSVSVKVTGCEVVGATVGVRCPMTFRCATPSSKKPIQEHGKVASSINSNVVLVIRCCFCVRIGSCIRAMTCPSYTGIRVV
jgi:hypothetical protein